MKSAAALLLLTASFAAAKPLARSTATVETVEAHLAADDAVGALADAEDIVARRGGASTYVARANAKRALGRPLEESIADYREAARLDPKYKEKYDGLVAQRESQVNPEKPKTHGIEMTNASDFASRILILLGTLFLTVVVAIAMIRGARDS